MFLTGRAGSSFLQREALCAAGRVGQELSPKARVRPLLTLGLQSTSPLELRVADESQNRSQ